MPGCLGCGYDLSASEPGLDCPECGCTWADARRAPAVRWLRYHEARWTGLALRLGAIALGGHGWGTIALGIAITLGIMASHRGRAPHLGLAMGLLAMAGWGVYVLTGLASALVMASTVRRTAGEPRGLVRRRDQMCFLGCASPLVWIGAAMTGIMTLNLVRWAPVLVIATNALLIGGPAFASLAWASATAQSLQRGREARRRIARQDRRVFIAFGAWLLVSIAVSTFAYAWANGYIEPQLTDRQSMVLAAAVFLCGGASYGLMILHIQRRASHVRRKLRCMMHRDRAGAA